MPVAAYREGGVPGGAGNGFSVIHGTLDPASDPQGYAQVHRQGPSVVAIGKFDGIHRGHRALLARILLEARRRNLQAGVATFDVHPREAMTGVKHQYLTSLEERKALFADAGLDFMLLLRATPRLFAMEAKEFASSLVKALSTEVVVVGTNFRFGRKAVGDVNTFVELGIDAIAVDLHSGNGGTVSSSRIREELRAGRVECVADLLGRPYCVGGEITEEEGSRCLVEISPSSALPAAGAYTGQIAFNEVGVSSSHPAVLIIPSQSAGTTRVHVVRRDGRGALTRHARSARVVFERGCLDGRPPGASHGGGPMPMHVLPREVSRVAHSVATLHDGVDASHGVLATM
jgi:riboflavin kinase/FMN adenylyltransferase